MIGFFKTEVLQRKGPWRHLEAVEFATLNWVDWFNTRQLLAPSGYVPPAEYEARYYDQRREPTMVEHDVTAGIPAPARPTIIAPRASDAVECPSIDVEIGGFVCVTRGRSAAAASEHRCPSRRPPSACTTFYDR